MNTNTIEGVTFVVISGSEEEHETMAYMVHVS
jgi:hypothetical protein